MKHQLRASVREGRIPHAQLFAGISGIGKLQLALAYAQYLNCPHRTEEDSCGTCPTCLQFQHLQHPDLHFVFPIVKTDAGDTCDAFLEPWREIILNKHYFNLEEWHEALGVETKQSMIYEKESGEILRKLSLKAYGDGYKVMIIWQPEKMNADCANKLLKILEEPAEKTVFLLVSEHPEKLLSTIQSRVQTVRVPRLETETIAAALMQRGIDATKATDIARIANGSYLAAIHKADETEENQQEWIWPMPKWAGSDRSIFCSTLSSRCARTISVTWRNPNSITRWKPSAIFPSALRRSFMTATWRPS